MELHHISVGQAADRVIGVLLHAEADSDEHRLSIACHDRQASCSCSASMPRSWLAARLKRVGAGSRSSCRSPTSRCRPSNSWFAACCCCCCCCGGGGAHEFCLSVCIAVTGDAAMRDELQPASGGACGSRGHACASAMLGRGQPWPPGVASMAPLVSRGLLHRLHRHRPARASQPASQPASELAVVCSHHHLVCAG